jgi:hypothetical protein
MGVIGVETTLVLIVLPVLVVKEKASGEESNPPEAARKTNILLFV